MKKTLIMAILIVASPILLLCSCKQDNNETDECSQNRKTTRQIVDREATVKVLSDGTCYLVEKNTIDNRLTPCNLATEYLVNDLKVIISADVKETTLKGTEPCCRENIVITQIVKL